MGIFTWTDATIQNPEPDDHGYYPDSQVVNYGGYAKLVCPDDTELETKYWDYYGRICGYDVYDLVVEWNKDDLLELFEAMPDDRREKKNLMPIVKMYVDGVDEEEIGEFAAERFDADYMRHEWKREIGIAIACDDEDADKLKYPIKLTSHQDAHGYNNLFISRSTQ